jgi:hypothetical protein
MVNIPIASGSSQKKINEKKLPMIIFLMVSGCMKNQLFVLVYSVAGFENPHKGFFEFIDLRF